MTGRSVTNVRAAPFAAPGLGVELGTALAELAVQAAAEPGGPLRSHLRTITQHLPVIVYALDAGGHYLWCYGGGLASLGLVEDELVGAHVSSFGETAQTTFDAVVASGVAQSFEVEGETAGVTWALLTVVAPMPGGNGVAAVAIDRTHDLLLARQADEQERLYDQVVSALDEGITVQDGSGNLLSANQRALDILGAARHEVVGTTVDDERWVILDESGRRVELDQRVTQQALADGQPRLGEVVGMERPDGSVLWMRVNAYPIELHGDRALVTSFVDITEHRATTAALVASDARFELLTAAAPIGIFTLDEVGTVTYVNAEIERQVGRGLAELVELGYDVAIHPDDRDRMAAVHAAFGREPGDYLHEYRVLRPDGTAIAVRVRLAPIIDGQGRPAGFVGTSADISDLVHTNAQLAEREERLRAIVETAAEGIITADESRLILEFNAAAERILGYDSEEVVRQLRFDDLVAQPQREHLIKMFEEYLAGAPSRFIGHPAQEVGYVRKDGSVVAVELAVTEVMTSEGRIFTGVLHDISERKAFERELEHQSTHDALTGLPNRALLLAELETALHRAARHRTSIGVFFVQLARMKLVTDSLGHRAGDQLVVEAARRLEKLSESCTVTRFGGDNFAVFYEDIGDINDAVELAALMIEKLDEPYMVSSEEAFIKCYVGVSFASQGSGSAESLISNADVAMNRARVANGPGFEVFDSDMRATVDARRKLEIAVRHGIERGEFELYYQPILSIDTNVIHGFEALIRWNHPERGVVPPYEFIPLAEDSGLIIPLGEWILHEACSQLAEWQRTYPDRGLRVAVNLSGRQLALPDLPATVAAALLAAGADPKGLDIEITETVLLDDVVAAGRTLEGLKKIGVNLSMDDFGTGYSSLTYLCQFPIDIVKIDRSFVSQLGTDSRDASIAPLVIRLAQSLGLAVVAEGVETKEQLNVLADLECTYAQGYYFSKPKPKTEAERMIKRGSRRSERF